jgi:hypothetical protein
MLPPIFGFSKPKSVCLSCKQISSLLKPPETPDKDKDKDKDKEKKSHKN